jgi:hypothetical protein
VGKLYGTGEWPEKFYEAGELDLCLFVEKWGGQKRLFLGVCDIILPGLK